MARLVSVVVPCFNAARWLGAALLSLQRQERAELEIVAVDDGSTDATSDILARAARDDARVRVVRLERNQGIVGALNRGLAEARGEYIARMDADDVAMPERLHTQVAFLLANGLDLCGSWFVEFGQGLARTTRWPHREAGVKAGLLFQNPICHPTVLARRQVFEKFQYREEYRLAEDYDLFSRASAECRMANVPQALIRYRRHRDQATQARREAMEAVTRKIRLANLARQGHAPSPEEQRLHNMIRAPASIERLEDLRGIEHWLVKLHASHVDPEARRLIASQWVRACIRAAPLGRAMWQDYRASPLRAAAGLSGAGVDLWVLSRLKLDYCSRPFELLRRFGISV